MSNYTCKECGASGRDEVEHRPECSNADLSLAYRLRSIEERLARIEEQLGIGDDE